MKSVIGTESHNDRIRDMLWTEALIVLQSVIYGFGDPISKIAFETVPVYSMMSIRYGIAFLICLVFFGRRILVTLRTSKIRSWLVPGVLIGMCYLLNNVALSLTEATSAAFLRSLSVIITPVFSFILFGKCAGWRHIAVQIMVIPGLYLLCVKGVSRVSGRGKL